MLDSKCEIKSKQTIGIFFRSMVLTIDLIYVREYTGTKSAL